MTLEDLKEGHYYSNGAYGRDWGVRLLVRLFPPGNQGDTLVEYKGIAGNCRRQHGRCDLQEFAAWARNEVALNENSWQKVYQD